MPGYFRKKIWLGFLASFAALYFGCNVNDPSVAPQLPRSLMKNLRYGIKISDSSTDFVFTDAYPHKMDLNDSALRKRVSGKRLYAFFTINNLPVRYKYSIKIVQSALGTPELDVAISNKDSSWFQLEEFQQGRFDQGYKSNYNMYVQDSLVYQDSIEIIPYKK